MRAALLDSVLRPGPLPGPRAIFGMQALVPRLLAAAGLAVSGYVHAYLYGNGYRAIPRIGLAFQWQSAASFAVAALLPITGLVLLRLAAAGLAAGSLVAFTMSRTIGVLGFTEHGWEPSPQTVMSVIAEAGVLVVLAVPAAAWLLSFWRRYRRTTSIS